MRFLIFIAITLCIGFAAMGQDADQPAEKPRPDVYPSRKLAARALADQIAGALPKEPFNPPKIVLTYSTNSVPPFTSDLGNSLQERFPSVSVEIEQVYRHKPTSAPTINIVDIPQNSTDRQGDFCAIFSNQATSSQGIKIEDQATAADWPNVAAAIADVLSKTPNVGPTITLIYSSNGPNVATDLADAIQAKFPSFSVVIEQVYRHKSTTAPAAVAPQTGNSNIAAHQNPPTVAIKPPDMSMEVKYVDKPWAADWTAFVNSEAPHRWTFADCPSLCPSDDDADQIAYLNAAQKIVPMLRQRSNYYVGSWTDDNLRNWVVKCLTGSHAYAVHDKFVQHFNVSDDGPSWQESILVSTDENTLATMVVPLLHAAPNGMSPTPSPSPTPDAVRKLGPAVSLVVVILLLYLFLNWITKGYFTTRLRMTVFLALLVISGLLLLALLGVRQVTYVQHAEQQRFQAEEENRQRAQVEENRQAFEQERARIAKQQVTGAPVHN